MAEQNQFIGLKYRHARVSVNGLIYLCLSSHDLASGFDFTIKENGLQIDQPPEIGNASVIRIIISKSDNAEGIIEFDPLYTSLQGK